MKFTHFLQVPMTGLGLHGGYRGDTWLINRLEIFNKFVLPSILAQTNRDFILWFNWRAEEQSNPIVRGFQVKLDKEPLKSIHTFGGILFWDDKYDDKTAAEKLLRSLEISLPKLKIDTDYVLVSIQPSDDMYLPDTIQRLQDKFAELLGKSPDTKKAVGYRRGYIMNYRTKDIAEYMSESWKTDEISTYHTDTIPPFFTYLFSREEFLDPEKHYKHLGPYHSHEQIADYFDYTALEGRGFIVGTHGENISTTFNNRYAGRMLSKQEADDIMKKVGILFVKPIVSKISMRHRVRKVLNVLPFIGIIKKIYYLLPEKLRII